LFSFISIVLGPSSLNRPPSPSTTETDEETSYERSVFCPLFNHKSITPLLPKSDLKILLCLMPDNFTQSIARGFYSSKGDPLGVKGLKQEKMFLLEKTVKCMSEVPGC